MNLTSIMSELLAKCFLKLDQISDVVFSCNFIIVGYYISWKKAND